jgi:itaconyl-CoA hydratase
LTNNSNQAHFNVEYAKASGLPNMIVNSALSLAIVAGLSVTDVSENGYNLGWTFIELPNPIFPGDTLFARSEVLELRQSGSRPHMGIVSIRTEGLNQDGICVVRFRRSILTWKKAHAPKTRSFGNADAAPARPSIFTDSPSATA